MKYKIKKPANLCEGPTWNSPFMDEYDGRIIDVEDKEFCNWEGTLNYTFVRLDNHWAIDKNWLVPLEEEKPKDEFNIQSILEDL